MSRFEKNVAPVKLDANGNLDTNILEKELIDALAFDVRYKQQDNMKKKAVKTSGTYDDFKNMVACSHLKTLTSKEVESLSDKKQGWQRDYRASNVDGAHILTQEAKKSDIDDAKKKELDLALQKVPNNLLVIERLLCLGTIKSHEERVEYLITVGLKKIKSLLKGEKDCSPELLECMLATVMQEAEIISQNLISTSEQAANISSLEVDAEVHGNKCASASTAASDNNDVKSIFQDISSTENTENIDNENSDVVTNKTRKVKTLDPYRWIKALSAFTRFHITAIFLPKQLLVKISAYLDAYVLPIENIEGNDANAAQAQVEEVRERFRKL
jgi:hypothetical protein